MKIELLTSDYLLLMTCLISRLTQIRCEKDVSMERRDIMNLIIALTEAKKIDEVGEVG